MTLLVMLAACMDACWTVEQPVESVLEFYPCWRELMRKLCNVCGPYAVHAPVIAMCIQSFPKLDPCSIF